LTIGLNAMPTLTIDNRRIEVPAGTKVIAAAEQLGIRIPRFCYHPALGSVGACRVCAVKVLEGPVKGIQMSCMLEARDGMVVSTTDAEAVAFRQSVIEWLMLHHPHDCPVCDEGGHCLLQDMTVSGGHGLRRYRGKKRTHRDQYLGPLVQHEMNRCIQCYRCVRYYREFSGYDDLGVTGIGNRVYYGRFAAGVLESPFAGNLIDICPTGVYTDKPSRFKGRRWDFERTPSICIHCSLGCAITVSSRYREVVRHEARFNPAVNGHFICDRGRFGYPYASSAARPREATVDGNPVEGKMAVSIAAERLAAIAGKHQPTAVAVAGSSRCSLETLAVLARTCRETGWRGPVCFEETRTARTVSAAVGCLTSSLAVSLQAITAADNVLVAGLDPVHEAPLLALALRQAQRNGAHVAVVDPRPVELPLAFAHLPLATPAIGPWLEQLAGDGPDGDPETAAIARRLRESARPVIIAGTDLLPAAAVAGAADLAAGLAAAGKTAGLFIPLPGANAFGAALVADGADSLDQVVDGIESGQIKALVLVESDLWQRFPDQTRLERALKQLALLVVLDYTASPTVDAAHVFLPTTTVYETGGVFINNAGRAQRAPSAMRGGTPISQTGQGNHPPRAFRQDIPGGDPRPAWHILGDLAVAVAGVADQGDRVSPLAILIENFPALASLTAAAAFPPEGLPVLTAAPIRDPLPVAEVPPAHGNDAVEGLELIWTDRVFGSEPLSARAPALQERQETALLTMTPGDARAWQMTDGDRVAIGPEASPWELTVRVVDTMAPGTIVLPRLPGWQRCGLKDNRVRQNDIRPRS
jgi:NADH-quinone oxidoreductase subunit G